MRHIRAQPATRFQLRKEALTSETKERRLGPVPKRDPKYHDHMEESEVYDGYREVQGIMTPSNITRYRDDEMVNQRFFNETEYNVMLADSLFPPKSSAHASATPKQR